MVDKERQPLLRRIGSDHDNLICHVQEQLVHAGTSPSPPSPSKRWRLTSERVIHLIKPYRPHASSRLGKLLAVRAAASEKSSAIKPILAIHAWSLAYSASIPFVVPELLEATGTL